MSRPLNMLALVTDAWGGRGGIAQYNRDLLGALAKAGAGAITVLPRHAPDPAAPPPEVRQAKARPGRLAYSLDAVLLTLSNPVEVVFCGHLYMAPLARLIARIKGAKLVIQTHGIEAWTRPKAAQRAALENADLVLAVSRYTRQSILGWAAIPPERVVVLPNTVGEGFTPGDGAALRTAWGLEGARVLLTVGRMDSLERYKGHDRIIAALPSLAEDVVYLAIGDGDDRPRLEALARDLGVAGRVRFAGAQSDAVRLEAYRMADLFVMPSTGEGFGIVFLEAMACGTPALGLGVAGARDALGDGELGHMARRDDLVDVIHSLLAREKPPADVLASAVSARFGRQVFAERVAAVVPLMRIAA